MKLDHINIKADAETLDEVRDFYCAILALQVGERPSFSSQGYWLYSEGQALVHLSVTEMRPPALTGTHLDHVAFKSDDLEKVRGRLRAAGIGFEENTVSETGLRQVFFLDPVGNGVEVNG